LRGNPGKRPLPAGEAEHPIAPTIPEPPRFLLPDAKAEWRRLAPGLYHMHLLTVVDEMTFAAYCQAYARWVAAETALKAMAERDELTHGLLIKTHEGNAIQNPLVGTANRASRNMISYATEFGFTPASRARVAGGPNPSPGRFDGLIG
jgi:P27 family predicted phage terminase small subunit